MMNLQVLEQYYKDGWLIKQSHPELPLTIWNYSLKTQYEGCWDEITLQCRGLVTYDYTGEIVARPFEKFFNLEEQKHTTTDTYEIFEKMDGSLIIIFYAFEQWIIASRGSFISDQTKKAYNLLNNTLINTLDKNFTFMFEIIYPSNRIVVNYGDTEQLIMLGSIKTSNGIEMKYDVMLSNYKHNFTIVKKYNNINNISLLKNMVSDDAEGFVVKFSNGDRMKVKGEKYFKLHKIISKISTKSIWETLYNGVYIEDYLHLTEIPDEFYYEIKIYYEDLLDQYWEINNKAKSMFKLTYIEGMDKSTFALKIKHIPQLYKVLLFFEYDMKFTNYSEVILNSIKPEFKKL